MRWLWSALALLAGLGRRRHGTAERGRIVSTAALSRRGENAVLGLLGLATVSSIAFVVVYAVDRVPAQTQLLGLSLGLAFAFLAAAAVVASRHLVPVEEIGEPYPDPSEHRSEVDEVAQIVEESGDRVTRRGLLKVAAGGAGASLGLALIAPLASLGPALDTDRLRESGWRRGLRLVDSAGRPLPADAIDPKGFYTAFPEGLTREELWSPLVVVRVDPERLRLPDGRAADRWAPDGIVAYSKTCTHAACAVSLYRTPLYEPTSKKPALVCPCHYSTFDPATGGAVLFGPAGRPLPQLPLEIDGDGNLRAGGPFSGAVGPSWSGVRT